ncbi:MAG: IS110 family transposase [Phycisphaerae bacterium]|nr:IS110 family transposase [Phycisphaerae bacterium]
MRNHTERSVCVGLDYHARSVQVAILDEDGREVANRSCRNDIGEVAAVCAAHGRVRSVAIEACCGASDFAHRLAETTGWSTNLAHPGFVSRMKQSPDKSDRSDANVLADLGRVGYLPKVWLAPAYIRELRMLDSLRDALVADIKNRKLRVQAVLREQRSFDPIVDARPWTRRWMTWLRDEAGLSDAGRFVVRMELHRLSELRGALKEAEARLEETTRGDRVVAALMEQRGVGKAIAWKLRARVGRFGRFRTGKQLCRFCGLSPRNASSGQRQADSGLINACDRPLRAMLLQAGHTLRTHDVRWRAHAAGMARRGKLGSVVAAAIANRWLRGLFHRMKELGMENM